MISRRLFAFVLLALAIAPAALAQDVGHSLRWGRPQYPHSGACFFKDAGFRGDYFCLRDGQMAGSLPGGFNDRISSIRTFRNSRVSLFNDSNFRGQRITFRRSVDDLRNLRLQGTNKNWGDRISSISVNR